MKETADTTPAQKLAFIEGELAGLDVDAAMAPIKDYINKAWIGLLLVILAFAGISIYWGPLTAAKVLVAAILFGMSVAFVVIFICRKTILAELITLEEMGFYLQEEIVLNCNDARKNLYTLREKIEAKANPVTAALMPEMLKYVGPLATMLMKKETGTLKWLMLGLKIGKNAFDSWKQRKDG
jgi:hypothetical protein